MRGRREEIEKVLLNRILVVSSETSAGPEPTHAAGLRALLTVALDFSLEGIERGERGISAIPSPLLTQARIAARARISLDTVLRRYFACYTLLVDFLVEEVERGEFMRDADLKRLLRDQAALFDRLLASVGEEHARETASRSKAREERRAEPVERLLAGELIDASALKYEFEAWHLGLIAAGPRAEQAVGELLSTVDARRLVLPRAEGVVWIWLGARRRLDPAELQRQLAKRRTPPPWLAIGEPGQGIDGWRLSHRQARTALPLALRGSHRFVRYSDVALLASTLRDDVLSASLRELYLAPLEAGRDEGAVARDTLRAYFGANRQVSSTAAALGVSRQTVGNRLRVIEERLGRTIESCAPEVEAALRLEAAESNVPSDGAALLASSLSDSRVG